MAAISLPTHGLFIDRTGQKKGKLTVVAYAGRDNRGRHQWLCRCDCGTEKVLLGTGLGTHTTSCGCHRLNIVRTINVTHGMTSTAIYRRYRAMIARCENPAVKSYADYGAKGVRVCDRWRESFVAFLEDMGPPPSPLHTIDRFPDTTGNYEPGNVRWATMREQGRNKRNNRLLEFNGASKPLAQWEQELGLPTETLRQRIDKLGWSVERALTTPCRKIKKRNGGVPSPS